uniref:Chorismate mutase n=1 Tax=Streptoalloteichus sp. ATCC 53650 TaxID=756733 RepID=K4PC07_9PSEU|nr:chorismate mutase [Streptoalloteichus sp. ATCC 53650]
MLDLTRLKHDEQAVRSPDRVEQVIARVRDRAAELGVEPDVVERTYRALITALTDLQMTVLLAGKQPEGASKDLHGR